MHLRFCSSLFHGLSARGWGRTPGDSSYPNSSNNEVLSNKVFLRSQLVSAVNRQPRKAAPFIMSISEVRSAESLEQIGSFPQTKWRQTPRFNVAGGWLLDRVDHPRRVSIHAPTRGATLEPLAHPDSGRVSIHAPTRGVTAKSTLRAYRG